MVSDSDLSLIIFEIVKFDVKWFELICWSARGGPLDQEIKSGVQFDYKIPAT